MAVREVLLFPHPTLQKRAVKLDVDADRLTLERVAQDLLDTMRSYGHCVGIAAPQIGELVRLIVVDVGQSKATTAYNGELVLVNPVVVESTGEKIAREGCLSIPDYTANVSRATAITLSAQSVDGKQVEIQSEGFEARCLLHEIDHLDGILFLDRVSSLKDDVFRRKSRKN